MFAVKIVSMSATASALIWVATPAAIAQHYPTKPIRLISPFAPGGGTDILSRVIGPRISSVIGQPVVVDNRPGAGGALGAEITAKAEPDGYTFVVGTPGTHAINQFVFKNMTYDQAKDIAPVIDLNSSVETCAVLPSPGVP